MSSIQEIRETFLYLHRETRDPDQMLEIIGASFIANERSIFGKPNEDFITREIAWYWSRIPNIRAMMPPVPKIWEEVSGDEGQVNSHYGYLIFSEENGSQYRNVWNELTRHPAGRRATMIYTRPTMHTDATADGKNDFICTNAVSYFIRDGRLNAVVQMRSNDVVYGYRNDFAWQSFVLDLLCADTGTQRGQIVWQAASLHVYPRHRHLVEKWGDEYDKEMEEWVAERD